MSGARLVLAGFVLLALGACTSTPTSPSGRPTSPQEAAKFNAQLAIEYMRKGDLAVAREKVDRALTQDPNNVEVQMTAGLLYDRLGDDKKAEEHYAAALRLKPDDPEMQNNYGVYLCRKGKIAEGEKLLLKAANEPGIPDAGSPAHQCGHVYARGRQAGRSGKVFPPGSERPAAVRGRAVAARRPGFSTRHQGQQR